MSAAMDEMLLDNMEQDVSVSHETEDDVIEQVPAVTAVNETATTNYHSSQFTNISRYLPTAGQPTDQ